MTSKIAPFNDVEDKVGFIVQARMTSTRLPGKVLMPIHISIDGQELTMLEAVITRLRASASIKTLIIATTVNQTDDPIVELCHKLEVPVFRGSENNVLERYYLAAKEHQLTTVIRVTSDCPVIDVEVIDQMYNFYLKNGGEYDYVSNLLERTYPRGLDAEVFSFSSLEMAYLTAKLDLEKEHVTSYIYSHPEKFRLFSFSQNNNWSQYRLTVDTEADLFLIQRIYDHLYPTKPGFLQSDLIEFLLNNPELAMSNQHIEQKDNSSQIYKSAEGKKKVV